MTERMTVDQYRAELAKDGEQSEAEKIARKFEWQIRARRLPAPRWKYGPGGEVKFASAEVDIPRQNRRKKTKRAPQWAFDFAWPEQRIAVEVEGLVVFKGKDGATQVGGRHANIQGFKDDCEKYAWAAVLGWTVLRFEQSQVRSGFAVDMLVRLFAAIKPPGLVYAGREFTNEELRQLLDSVRTAPIVHVNPELPLGPVVEPPPF